MKNDENLSWVTGVLYFSVMLFVAIEWRSFLNRGFWINHNIASSLAFFALALPLALFPIPRRSVRMAIRLRARKVSATLIGISVFLLLFSFIIPGRRVRNDAQMLAVFLVVEGVWTRKAVREAN